IARRAAPRPSDRLTPLSAIAGARRPDAEVSCMFRCSLMRSLVGSSALPRSYGSWRGRVQTFALVAMMLALAVALRAPAAATDRPVRIVVLGDSLTARLGLRADGTLSAQLEQALTAKGPSGQAAHAGGS